MNDISGIWFYGLSGVGKSFASKYFYSKIKDKSIIIDGDDVRKYISKDLNYTIEDREIQIQRIFGIAKICILSKFFPIVSSVYMNKNILQKANSEKIIVVKIDRSISHAKKNNITYKEKKNVLGIDLQYEILDTKKIYNTGENTFCKQLDSLIS